MRVSAFPRTTDRFLLTPADCSASELGTGMRPEGISRTLSSFSNQYRAPMTVIFSMLTLLSRACGPQAGAEDLAHCGEYIGAINQSAFRLLRSCKWITEHMQLSYGLSPNRPSRTNLYGHLRELFTAAAAIIEPAGIPVTARIPDGVLPVACDTEKLGLIIGNLLSNACRFTRPGNRITVRVRRQQEAVFVTISDRGLGIPADIQPRVLKRIFPMTTAAPRLPETGLDLPSRAVRPLLWAVRWPLPPRRDVAPPLSAPSPSTIPAMRRPLFSAPRPTMFPTAFRFCASLCRTASTARYERHKMRLFPVAPGNGPFPIC